MNYKLNWTVSHMYYLMKVMTEDLRFCGILDLSFDSGSTGVSPIYRPGETRWCGLWSNNSSYMCSSHCDVKLGGAIGDVDSHDEVMSLFLSPN